MYLKTLYPPLLGLILLVASSGCNTTSDNSKPLSVTGEFGAHALQNKRIYKLETRENRLFAGTSQGLVSFDISGKLQAENTFMKETTVPTFALAADNNWMISADFGDDLSSRGIYRSTDRGNTWSLYNNGFGGNWQVIPYTMDVSGEDPALLFARPGPLTVVARSNNGGQSWETVVQSWENPNFGNSRFVKIDRYHPERVWAGGATAQTRPRLLKSEDGGKTWTGLLVIENVETTVHDVAIHPSQPNTILAGMAGAIEPANLIRKSTDGGQTWSTSFREAGIYTFTRSVRNPEVVYASGEHADGTLFFAASGDFGDSWQTVEMPDSPTGIQANDMVSVMKDGQEVLYLGTNQGMYSYRFEE